jgi:hypothetical protein
LRLLWIKGIQSGSDIVAAGNFFQHLLQIGRLEIEVNGATQPGVRSQPIGTSRHQAT